MASTAGIGVGYPLAGLLTEVAGVRAAYALGLAVTAAALAAALLALPTDDPARAARPVDWTGAGLLGGGLGAVLLVTGDTDLWMTHPPVAPAVLAAGVLILTAWVVTERRTPSPLVDLTALRLPAVAGANLVMGVSGVGMYLLLTLITRYAQTPPGAGDGYGLSTFQAGLVLVPFSVLGFVAAGSGPGWAAGSARSACWWPAAVWSWPPSSSSRRLAAPWPARSSPWPFSGSASAGSRPPCPRPSWP